MNEYYTLNMTPFSLAKSIHKFIINIIVPVENIWKQSFLLFRSQLPKHMPNVSVVPESKPLEKGENAGNGRSKTDSANDIEYNFYFATIPDKSVLSPMKKKAKYLLEHRPRHSPTDSATYVTINIYQSYSGRRFKKGCVDLRFIVTCQWRFDFDYFNIKEVFQTGEAVTLLEKTITNLQWSIQTQFGARP